MAIDDNASYDLTGYQVKDLAQKIRAKADSSSLANVATSGLYSDLTGAPTIPTVYNGTLTLQQNGTTLDTFTANSSTNKTVNITTSNDTYSTTEVDTGKEWIDGKPIYRKVYTGTWSATGNVSVTVATDSTVENIIATGGWFDDNTAKIAFGQRHWMSNTGSDSTSFAMIAPAGLVIRLVNGSGILTDRPYQIWVEYTKS